MPALIMGSNSVCIALWTMGRSAASRVVTNPTFGDGSCISGLLEYAVALPRLPSGPSA